MSLLQSLCSVLLRERDTGWEGKGRDGMEDISANVDNASNLVHQTNSSESFMKQRRYVAYNCNEACDSDAESYVGTSHDQH